MVRNKDDIRPVDKLVDRFGKDVVVGDTVVFAGNQNLEIGVVKATKKVFGHTWGAFPLPTVKGKPNVQIPANYSKLDEDERIPKITIIPVYEGQADSPRTYEGWPGRIMKIDPSQVDEKNRGIIQRLCDELKDAS